MLRTRRNTYIVFYNNGYRRDTRYHACNTSPRTTITLDLCRRTRPDNSYSLFKRTNFTTESSLFRNFKYLRIVTSFRSLFSRRFVENPSYNSSTILVSKKRKRVRPYSTNEDRALKAKTVKVSTSKNMHQGTILDNG